MFIRIGWGEVDQKPRKAEAYAEKNEAEKIDFEVWTHVSRDVWASGRQNAFGLNCALG